MCQKFYISVVINKKKKKIKIILENFTIQFINDLSLLKSRLNKEQFLYKNFLKMYGFNIHTVWVI